MKNRLSLVFLVAVMLLPSPGAWAQKQRVTIDEFFNYVTITSVRISPDGKAVLIGTRRADWEQQTFRRDIWIYREGTAGPTLLSQSGQDVSPEWSPDGKWIAFESDRPAPARATGGNPAAKSTNQLYVISAAGGEAFPVTRGEEAAGEFAWASDSKSLFFSTREPLSKEKRDQIKKEWKDVERFRESERGDVIARISIAKAIGNNQAMAVQEPGGDAAQKDDQEKRETAETPGAQVVARTPYSVGEIAVSPDGSTVAFCTEAPSHRIETTEDHEIYVVLASGGEVRKLTQNRVVESGLRWSRDGKQLFFRVHSDVDGGYEQIQARVYAIEVATKTIRRWAGDFSGSLSDYLINKDGELVALGVRGTQVQPFATRSQSEATSSIAGWPGTYSQISTAEQSPRVAFIYSSLERPTEVYLADNIGKLRDAVPITSFNKLFAERDLPRGVPYKWRADDGSEVEGMLIYPPGKFGVKHLRMLTLIHGGPAAADGDRFRADHYDWAILAASNDWLVFRPNYRGSTGYGDKFQREISPQIVSRPGKDILAGVDALVRDGIADPNQLTLGGYSYGGYMTNWLITQTTRFKAAVSGAGAVEHAANWGNDDLTFDDAWYLGGAPWEAQKTYNDEAALWQINKVKTPTHIVAGGSDVRVAVAEAYLLERALHNLKVPSTLLIFPGEGHSLGRNPWHGKIKVREELKWLDQYAPNVSGAMQSAVSSSK